MNNNDQPKAAQSAKAPEARQTFDQFLRRPIPMARVSERLQSFIKAMNKTVAVDDTKVTLASVSYQRKHVTDTISGLAFAMEHKDKEQQLYASVYVLWLANVDGCPVVSTDQFVGMDSEMSSAVGDMLSDVHSLLEGKYNSAGAEHTHIKVSYVGSTTIPTSVEFDDERVIALASFAIQQITSAIESQDDDVGAQVLSLMENESFKVTTSFHEPSIKDVLGFPIRNDVTLRLVHTLPRRNGSPNNSPEFLLLTVSGYVELVRAQENNSSNMRGFVTTPLRYVPRFVITSVDPGVAYFPLMLSTVFAIAMANSFMSYPDWIRVYEAIHFDTPDISMFAPEEAARVVSEEDRVRFIAQLMNKILVPIGHMVALDVPLNPTVPFGIVPEGLQLCRKMISQLESVLSHLGRRQFDPSAAAYIFVPTGVEIDVGTYHAQHYTHPRDSRYVDALFIRQHPSSGNEMSEAFEDSLFPPMAPHGAYSMSSQNDWKQRQSRKDLQEHAAGEITTHNVVSRYAVSRDGLHNIQRVFESSGVRLRWENMTKTRPSVNPGDY